jgi:hypothetical protein
MLRGRLLRARLHVDQVVGAGREHVRTDGTDRQRGLVLRVAWVEVRGTGDADERVDRWGGVGWLNSDRAERESGGHDETSA